MSKTIKNEFALNLAFLVFFGHFKKIVLWPLVVGFGSFCVAIWLQACAGSTNPDSILFQQPIRCDYEMDYPRAFRSSTKRIAGSGNEIKKSEVILLLCGASVRM